MIWKTDIGDSEEQENHDNVDSDDEGLQDKVDNKKAKDGKKAASKEESKKAEAQDDDEENMFDEEDAGSGDEFLAVNPLIG
jgi:hypothetical protein